MRLDPVGAPTGRAAPRDARFWTHPSTNGGKFHIDTDTGTSACGIALLQDWTVDPADVALVLRCRRRGCAERWPS